MSKFSGFWPISFARESDSYSLPNEPVLLAKGVERRAMLNQRGANIFQKLRRRCINMQHGAPQSAFVWARCNIACCNAPVKGVAMSDDADSIIDALKARFRVPTDQGLAERLRLGRSTVTSWRRRGSVPERYVRMAGERPTLLPDLLDPQFDPVEREALNLALLRLVTGPGAKIKDYPSFLQHGPFLAAQLAIGLEKALLDLSAAMTENDLEDPRQALNLMVFEDFF